MSPPETDATDRLDRVRVSIRSGPLVGPVLSRLVGVHAARAPLPIDRFDDAVLIADAIAARAPAYALGDRLPVSLRAGQGRLELRVGPLRAGAGRSILDTAALPGTGSIVERLADDVRVREGAGGEFLVISVGAAAPTP